jgi:C-terminal processing protease CtpA/Prc
MKDFKNLLLYLFVVAFLVTSCSKNDDGPMDPDPDNVTLNSIANLFTWNALNLWYFWQGDVPNLADSKNNNTAEFYKFLNLYDDPIDLFDNALGFSEDRFTFLTDNYRTLVESQQGVFKSNGVEFGLLIYDDGGTDKVFGYVRYIIPNSDAATKSIERGDIFIGVNGTDLDLNNYRSLLFGENDTYTLNMATLSGNTISPNNEEISLTKTELVENPVFITKIIDKGADKIGYLMYNGFTSNFNEELNDAFGTLKSAGVTDLVLDFRYNPGGSVNSSRLLSSMVYTTNTSTLYIRQRWNDKIQSQFSSTQLEDYFANQTGDGSPINSLGLDRVYVLTTGSTASASELVINGLDPYIDVIKIGTTTTGKNEFSITLVDNPSNSYVYSQNTENGINSNNSWGLQPLVGRNENANGFYDYTAGFDPDYELPEDLENLGVLGEEDEPLLAKAIEIITGVTTKKSIDDLEVKFPIEIYSSSKMFTPIKDNMYLDKEIKLSVN